ncbi:MAG: hypothetical protein IPK59_23410 [Rhodospirillaceae bacterium]|nr:hypothetical protein [Rhodospirillaceae bacterium]
MSTEQEGQGQGVTVPGESAPPANTGGTFERQGTDGQHGDDTESRARAMGWVPKDQFRGPAENWRDAGEFVRRGEEELPILRERLRSTTREIERMNSDFQQRIDMLTRASGVALQRQREQIESAYDAAMREATANADVARFDQLSRDKRQAIDLHDRNIREVVVGDPRQQQQPQRQNGQPPVEVTDWMARNPWFQSDDELSAAAAGYSRKLEKERPHLSLAENLAATERYIKQERYADRFGGAPRGAQVEGGSRVSSSNGRRAGSSNLPPEARKEGMRFVQQGLFKNLDDYAKEYYAQEGV